PERGALFVPLQRRNPLAKPNQFTTLAPPGQDTGPLWSFPVRRLADPLARFGHEVGLSAEVSPEGVQFWLNGKPYPTELALELLALLSNRDSVPDALDTRPSALLGLTLKHQAGGIVCTSRADAAEAISVLGLDRFVFDGAVRASGKNLYWLESRQVIP